MQVAKIVTTRLDRGVPVADVMDGGGNMYLQVRMITSGGGGQDSFSYIPPASGGWGSGRAGLEHGNSAEVLIAFPGGPRPHPFIIGTLFSAAAAKHMTAKPTGSRAAPGGAGTTGGQTSCEALHGGGPMSPKTALAGSLSDATVASHGASGGRTRIIIGYEGFVGLDMHANPVDGGFKLALGAEGCVRVSHTAAPPGSSHDTAKPYNRVSGQQWLNDEYPVDEYVLLGNAFLEHYQTLVAEVDRLRTWASGIAKALTGTEIAAQTAKTAAESTAPGTGALAYEATWSSALQGTPWDAENSPLWATGSPDGTDVKAHSWAGGDLAYSSALFKSAAFVLSSKNLCDPHKK